MIIKRYVPIGLWMLFAMAQTARAGTVTGVTVSPQSILVGGAVSVTVIGTNPCGAAHIIYADGAAVTYAITGLPTTQTHTYNAPGTYAIVARGMGNCDGEATTTVTVSAPPQGAPSPGAPAAHVTGVDLAPTPGRVREPVTISVKGTGTCAYEVHYGDGNAQEVNGQLPQQFRHTYVKPDTYTIIAGAYCLAGVGDTSTRVIPAAAVPRTSKRERAVPVHGASPVAATV
jgi:hypothetical protein